MANRVLIVTAVAGLAAAAIAAGAARAWIRDKNDAIVLAESMTGGSARAGQERIRYYGCAACHTIPGIPQADATVGPPLNKFASRSYVGGVLSNSPDHLVRWIMDPPGVDPLTAMPRLSVGNQDARDIAAYLYTLR